MINKLHTGDAMRHIPNIVTISRIMLSVLIFFINPYTTLFIILYIICGLSDIVDGFIARKLSLESDLGARLDSLADMIFVIIIVIKLFPIIKLPYFIIYWMIMIAMIRLTSVMIVRMKFHTFAVLHTYLNKLTGITLLLFPLVYSFVDIGFFSSVICVIATCAAVEEMIIHIYSKELRYESKGLWIRYE